MITFECKSCGAPVSADEHQTTAVCKYCNLLQTFNLNEKLNQKLLANANRLRREMEYDRAVNMYDEILKDDPENAEVHWGKMLSRFGVAYVADSKTGKCIPTCNRMSETSVFLDPDYQECIENASMEAQMIYEDEARAIEKIRNTYYQIAQKEEPYDVFISYKDSVDNVRTRDSSMAEEVYRFLTEAGYRVFYSRITLENVLGEDYEPYIYAALQSARVMLVLGTKPEYINAEWVKNEWSRYLKLVLAEPEKRALIPLLREMKTSDLPKELEGFEGYDIGNWRFRDSLLERVKNLCNKKSELLKEKAQAMQKEEYRVHMVSAENMFIRAGLELEAGNRERADMFTERGLDLNPMGSEGYWLKLRVYTNDFQELLVDIRRAEQLYERAQQHADEPKKREYEIAWKSFCDAIQKNKLEKQKSVQVKPQEMTAKKETSERKEQEERASALDKKLQKAEISEKNYKVKTSISFYSFLFPALVLCANILYLALHSEGMDAGIIAKGMNAAVLISFLTAGLFCTSSEIRYLFVAIGAAAGGWNWYKGGQLPQMVLLFGVLLIILILVMICNHSFKGLISGILMAAVLTAMFAGSAFLAGAVQKNPEAGLEDIQTLVTEVPVEEVLNDWIGQAKQEVTR